MNALVLTIVLATGSQEPAPPPPSPSPAPPSAPSPPPPPSVSSERASELGQPTPFSRREATLPQLSFEGSAHLGLVGTGPTRITNELRFAATDWLELRTAFLPLPSSLMARVRIGDTTSSAGEVVVDGGVAHVDFGLQGLGGLTTETRVGVRAHAEAGAAWFVATSDRTRLVLQARTRYRFSSLDDDDEAIAAVGAALDIDLLRQLALSVGVGYATALPTASSSKAVVRETSVVLVESGRPGMTWLLSSDDDDTQSFTVPLALVYAPTESFDVDVFITPAIAPTFGLVAGAGVRIRL